MMKTKKKTWRKHVENTRKQVKTTHRTLVGCTQLPGQIRFKNTQKTHENRVKTLRKHIKKHLENVQKKMKTKKKTCRKHAENMSKTPENTWKQPIARLRAASTCQAQYVSKNTQKTHENKIKTVRKQIKNTWKMCKKHNENKKKTRRKQEENKKKTRENNPSHACGLHAPARPPSGRFCAVIPCLLHSLRYSTVSCPRMAAGLAPQSDIMRMSASSCGVVIELQRTNPGQLMCCPGCSSSTLNNPM